MLNYKAYKISIMLETMGTWTCIGQRGYPNPLVPKNLERNGLFLG